MTVGLKLCRQLQLHWAVFLLVTTHIAYASTKNTQIVQIKQESIRYLGWKHPTSTRVFQHHIASTNLILKLLANSTLGADSVKLTRVIPVGRCVQMRAAFSGVTSYSGVWRRGAGKRGLAHGQHPAGAEVEQSLQGRTQ